MQASWRPPSPAAQSQLLSLLLVAVLDLVSAVATLQSEWKEACRRPPIPVSTCLRLLL